MDSHIHEHEAEGDDHHHEKPSVLKKVKAKARKIYKDTLKKHGHGQNHDQDPDGHTPDDHDGHSTPDDHDLEEKDDEYEEMVEDPEVQGAPIYDSAAIKTGDLGGISEATAMPHGHGHEQPLASRDVSGVKSSDPTRISVPGLEENIEQPKSNFGKPSQMREEEPQAPLNTPVSSFPHGVYEKKDSTDPSKTVVSGSTANSGESRVNLQRPKGLKEDPHDPKEFNRQDPSNYQTKVGDPTGAGTEEVEALRSLDKMKICDETEPKPESKLITQAPTGSHDQFSPEPFPPKPSDTPQNSNAVEENLDTRDRNDRGTEEVEALRSLDKMKICDESEPKPESKLITQAPTGSHDQFSPEPFPPKPSDTPQNSNAVEENLDTRDRNDRGTTEINPTNATSYKEQLSYAVTVIADKTISAKNVVASKLGYGEKDDTTNDRVRDNEAHGSGDGSTSKPSSTVEYGKQIAATVTDKLTPVYVKVAGGGSTVISKMSGSGTTGAGNEAEKTEVKEQDRGVSVKDTFAEKLRPGDEDRALSELISDTLHKRKQEPEKAESGPPIEKVTQSEEVTRRLGTGDEKSDQEGDVPATGYVNRPEIGGDGVGKGVVDKLKGSVGSWFGLGGGDQSSKTSHEGDEQGYSASSVGGDSIGKDERST